MNLALRRTLKRLVCWKPANGIIRSCAPVLKVIIPPAIRGRIPIRADVVVKYGCWQPATMHNNGNDSISTRIFWCGTDSFDLESIELFLHLARNARIVMDIGANTGIYSLLVGANFPQAIVHSFEPVPEIVALFEESVRVNNFDKIFVRQLAVSDLSGKVDFFVPDNAATFPHSASTNKDFRDSTVLLTVESITIDEYVAQENLPTVDLIKIDTESTESRVVRGAERTLRQFRPLIICEVLPDFVHGELESLLGSQQYRYFWVSKNGLKESKSLQPDPDRQCLNYAFIPREKCEALLESLPFEVEQLHRTT